MIDAICRQLSLILLAILSVFNMQSVMLPPADFSYRCFMPTSDVHGMQSMLEAFAKAHGMSFRSGPLNPEGTTVAIQLDGKWARIFATNDDDYKEFYLDIERHGSAELYRAKVSGLNKELLEAVAGMESVRVEWVRLPENFPEPVPAARRTVRGPAL